ncbi:MAG: hypothetical protein JW395_1583 [Nitrospira sp.]|nr:hypothetical protein [Nitrospira sp.]
MNLTIIKSDNSVYIDGRAISVDCSDLPTEVHAIQWNGDSGWIEYINGPGLPVKINETIDSISAYQGLISAWNAEKEKTDAVAPAP